MDAQQLASYIDHTMLKAVATNDEIKILCDEAIKYEFATVCVNPCRVALAAELLKDAKSGVTTVIGFPLGAGTSKVKAFEAVDAIKNGADEIDMVINVGLLKSGDLDSVRDDIKTVKEACGNNILKVILETCLLTDDEIVTACNLCKEAGADFVKTSTGFSTGGATPEAVSLMRKTVGPDMGVKASGNVRTTEDAEKIIEVGASRIGASSGIAIVTGSAGDGSGY